MFRSFLKSIEDSFKSILLWGCPCTQLSTLKALLKTHFFPVADIQINFSPCLCNLFGINTDPYIFLVFLKSFHSSVTRILNYIHMCMLSELKRSQSLVKTFQGCGDSPCDGTDVLLGLHSTSVLLSRAQMLINNFCLHTHCSQFVSQSQIIIQQLILVIKTSETLPFLPLLTKYNISCISIFAVLGNQTQGLTHARQAIYHQASLPAHISLIFTLMVLLTSCLKMSCSIQCSITA